MSKIGYVRVSTVDQNTDRQEIALSQLGIEKLFIEKVSGKNTERPEFKKMIEYIREGDVLYIESMTAIHESYKRVLCMIFMWRNFQF
jgi:DNA invertase Pin-like site-specific DNA recombinase